MARMVARLRAQHRQYRDVGRGRGCGCAGCATWKKYRRWQDEFVYHTRWTRPSVGGDPKSADISYTHDPAARARWTGMDPVARRESNYNANAIKPLGPNAARAPSKRLAVHRSDARGLSRAGTSTNIHDLVGPGVRVHQLRERPLRGGRRRIESGRSDPAGRSSLQPQGGVAENAAEFRPTATKIPVICLGWVRRLAGGDHLVLGAHENTTTASRPPRWRCRDGAGGHCRRMDDAAQRAKPTGIVVTGDHQGPRPEALWHARASTAGCIRR